MEDSASEANRTHHGIVLDTSRSGFDRGAACYGSVFIDKDDSKNLFLFYAGAQDPQWSHSTIGLAVSSDSFNFKKMSSNPIIDDSQGSFCHKEALSPVVTRVSNRYYMILSGRASAKMSRRIGIAHADDPKGPWHIIGELIKPSKLWEGNAIDNGSSLVKLSEETILLYYSSVTTPKAFDIATFLRRYPIRRIGILKVRIRGASRSSIEALRFSGNPLKHLNGPKGNWNESVFSPGHIQFNDNCYMFPAASAYSFGFPYRQSIGMVTSNSHHFHKDRFQITKLIDGPLEKSKIIHNIKSEIALDMPALLIDQERNKLFMYYSVADRADEVWKIALTTFDLNDIFKKSE